jgi:hypothetical protein
VTEQAQPLTAAQRWLALATGLACTALAVLGGVGSFDAVSRVAASHGFAHPWRVPLGVDLGVLALFNADLLLEWLGMSFVPLRWIAHTLVGATIWFNMAASAGDPLGMAMHAVAPVLVVIWVEGVRHAIRTRARMAKRRRHIESAQLGRWLLAPVATAKLWRRQQLWNVASYSDALALEQRRLLAVARLRSEHGWRWRLQATALERHALRHGLLDDLANPANSQPATTASQSGSSASTPPARLPARATPKGRRGGRGDRTERARAWIRERRAAGGARPEGLHLQLRDEIGLERTYAKRLVTEEWPEPAAASTSTNGQGGAS